MSTLYPRWSNRLYWAVLTAGGLTGLAAIIAPMIYVRTPYYTRQYHPVEQPVQFDHRHHVRDDGIDCLYCHTAAESSATAGVPATDVCMGCHVQVWNDSPLLSKVRQAYFAGRPIHWQRVHALPDHVYFHHGVHVQAGLACQHCHGAVGRMARVYQQAPLTMGWCLDCHRAPQTTVARNDRAMGLSATHLPDDLPSGRSIHRLTNCTSCHR